MNKAIDALATPDETKEIELAIIQAKGLIVEYIGFQGDGDGGGVHLYNLVKPELPGYDYSDGLPTFSLEGLRERGLVG